MELDDLLLGDAWPGRILTPNAQQWPNSDSLLAMMRALSWMLRQLRESRDLQVMEIAARCGVSNSVLSRVELARRPPRLELLLMVCHELGVRFSDVMRFAEDEAFPLGSEPWTDESFELIARHARHHQATGGGV